MHYTKMYNIEYFSNDIRNAFILTITCPKSAVRTLNESSRPVSASLEENKLELQSLLQDCHDMAIQFFSFGEGLSFSAMAVYCKPLTVKTDSNLFRSALEDLAGRASSGKEPCTPGEFVRFFQGGGAAANPYKLVTDLDQAVQDILSGCYMIFIESWDNALSMEALSVSRKQIQEPVSESVIFGPREGSVDDLDHNLALLRVRLRTPLFKIELTEKGTLTKSRIMIGYIKGKVNEEALSILKTRLEGVRDVEILDATSIREMLEDSKYSPFPQYRLTERLDVAVSAMLDGKIILMADGSGTILISPALFVEFFQSAEDYYQRTIISSMVRLMRIVSFFLALTLPSLYIALSNYHPELIPTNLLLTLLNSREGLPFSSFIEAMLMQFFFELLREAGIRLPRPIGAAVSIVGALIIGEAAIRAGIASPVIIVVISLTGIASFSIPQYEAAIAIRIFVFPLMALTYMWGGFGMLIGFIFIFLHITSLHSLGQPYFSPLAPLNPFRLLDVLVRAPVSLYMRMRRKSQAGK